MPVALGARLTVTISDIAFGGEGVARVDDFVVFVPFVLAGEIIEAEVTETKRNFARARLLRVVQASPERVVPACRYFGECGGCQYQHMEYAAQLRIKQKQIGDLFERIGGFPPGVVGPVIPCPQAYGYRNRVMVRSQWDKFKKGLNIGFVRTDNRLVVDIEECKIAEPAINEQLKQARAHPPPRGGLKVVLRIPPKNWELPSSSFFQNNFFLLPRLVEAVRERLRHSGTRHLVDLYCGVGFFAIELAGSVESFIGVEYDQQAIAAARNNAANHGRANGEFLAARVEEILPDLQERYATEAVTVLLDPPRKGCSPRALQLLRRKPPRQVIYISCHPATMARDLNILCADRVFDLLQVSSLDMFPQTQHVECVADLRCGSTRLTSTPDACDKPALSN